MGCGDKAKPQLQLPSNSDTLRYEYFMFKGERLGVKAEYQIKTTKANRGKKFNRHGYYREYYTNGQLKTDFHFYEDLKDGPSITYYKDGKVYEESHWSMNKMDGPYRLHYPNGTLREELIYDNGIINGDWKTFYQDSMERFHFVYDDGLLWEVNFLKDSVGTSLMNNTIKNGEGVFYSFYRDGSLKSKCDYKKGLPNGDAEYYFLNGELVKKGAFHNGLKDGKWYIYFKGEKLKEEVNYQDGRLAGQQRTYFENGKINSEFNFKEDRKVAFDSTALENIIKRDFIDESSRFDQPTKLRSARHGVSVSYYPNGNMKQEGNFYNDIPMGRFAEYYENGNLMFLRESDSTYVNNMIFEKKFDINGKVVDSVYYSKQNQ